MHYAEYNHFVGSTMFDFNRHVGQHGKVDRSQIEDGRVEGCVQGSIAGKWGFWSRTQTVLAPNQCSFH